MMKIWLRKKLRQSMTQLLTSHNPQMLKAACRRHIISPTATEPPPSPPPLQQHPPTHPARSAAEALVVPLPAGGLRRATTMGRRWWRTSGEDRVGAAGGARMGAPVHAAAPARDRDDHTRGRDGRGQGPSVHHDPGQGRHMEGPIGMAGASSSSVSGELALWYRVRGRECSRQRPRWSMSLVSLREDVHN